VCSTPRGITGKIALSSGANFDHHASAQRLAASPEKSHCCGSKAGTDHCGAQRLAASPEKSLAQD